MQSYVQELDALFSAMHEDVVILTPNKRLGRFLDRQYALFQASRNITSWPSIQCYSVNVWFQTLWDTLAFQSEEPSPLLMNPSQELSIWLDVIREHSDDVELFNQSATAGAARRALTTAIQWQCDLSQESSVSSVFKQWLREYKAYCDRWNLLDVPSMVSELILAFRQGSLSFPNKIILFAFDDINPQLANIMMLAEQAGSVVDHFNIRMSGRVNRVTLKSVSDEITSAAKWAASVVQREPDATIGIVIPQLLPLRAKVEQIFTEIFEPQYILPDQDRHASGFNISAGVSLSDSQPIAAALLTLKFNYRELNIEDVSKLLHSPFIGIVDELPARALLAEQLREQFIDVRVSSLRAESGAFGRDDADDDDAESRESIVEDFYQRLQQFHDSQRNLPPALTPSEWGALFCRQLEIVGWPGSRSLDTLEYQQVEAWQHVIMQLSYFDYIFERVSLTRALELLERLAFDTQFQAQTQDSPVQILGIFEAAGMVFDHLWVMNFDNESWPPPINPNPVLPLALQKRESMPMSSAERELLLAQKITDRFSHSARNVVFSYAMMDGDKELKVSPLIEGLLEIEKAELPVLEEGNSYCEQIFDYGGVDAFVDSCGASIDDPKTVRGGTQILKDQAACPFKAFAVHRLNAGKKHDAVAGLNAAERGILIHNALEIIWKKLRRQEKLLSLSTTQIDELIRQSVASGLRSIESAKMIGARLKELESDRAFTLLRAWLELEKQRAPFSVIFSETKKNIRLAKLPIHIRYDRIDKLEDGSLFIIDYKTAKLDIRSWAGSRPDEPQVPIYGVANEQKVSGVAFGQVNVDQVAFKGISEQENIIPGVPTPDLLTRLELPDSWPDIIAHWRTVLESLAKEFVAGSAEVKPKHKINSCRHCDLHSLCRIKEFIEVEDEDEVSEDDVETGPLP